MSRALVRSARPFYRSGSSRKPRTIAVVRDTSCAVLDVTTPRPGLGYCKFRSRKVTSLKCTMANVRTKRAAANGMSIPGGLGPQQGPLHFYAQLKTLLKRRLARSAHTHSLLDVDNSCTKTWGRVITRPDCGCAAVGHCPRAVCACCQCFVLS